MNVEDRDSLVALAGRRTNPRKLIALAPRLGQMFKLLNG
jgi:hypothetical protein